MTVSPEKIAEMLPALFWEPAERGSTVELRIRAHATGNGEVIAKGLTLENAKAIIAAVNAVTTLRSQLSGITDETSSWQPIETAPKDGTTVDLYGTRSGRPYRFPDARWLEIHMMGTGDPTGEYRWLFPAWDIYGEFEFTHWQPIPTPPSGAHP